MGRKTGKEATYITNYDSDSDDKVEVREILNGQMMGVSFNSSKNSYYTMIPKALLPKGAKRSKQVWLKSDKSNAIIKFRAIVRELKGEKESTFSIEKYATKERYEIEEAAVVTLTSHPKHDKLRHFAGIELKDGETKEVIFHKKVPYLDIPEHHYIQWLKEQLRNPSELAKKTGIDAFNKFNDWMLQEQIKLKDIYKNYINSNKYQHKIKDKNDKQKTKKTWDVFVNLIDKSTIEQIQLNDVKKFETYLNSKKLADKTIHHYKNRVTKIFRYNLKEYEDISIILKVLGYFDKWGDLEVNSSNTIAAQVIKHSDFMALYNAADKKGDIQLKAVMMLCLNSATYIREVARFKITDIDLSEQTLMTNRNKKGRCRKFAYLWDRTILDLKEYLATRKDKSNVLFLASHGGEYLNGEGLRARFYQIRKEFSLLNIEFSHLRDTFQTLANEIGVKQYHSNMVMGHSTGKTSERYSHRRIHNELKEACLAVEKEFFPKEEAAV